MDTQCRHCESTDIIKTADGRTFCFTCMNFFSTDSLEEIRAKEAGEEEALFARKSRKTDMGSHPHSFNTGFIRRVI
jgi:hypothetical protein